MSGEATLLPGAAKRSKEKMHSRNTEELMSALESIKRVLSKADTDKSKIIRLTMRG